MPMTPAITGLLLAGGEGRRMGGIDKGLLDFGGRPLAQHVLERLHPQVDRVLISANRNLDAYRAFGHPVVADRLPGYAGPLAGLQAAMGSVTTALILTVPCDSPWLPTDLAQRLLVSLQSADAKLAVPRAGGRVHRAFCLLRRELAPALDTFLAAGGRRIGAWHAEMDALEVDFDDVAANFGNLNTPDDLAVSGPVAARER